MQPKEKHQDATQMPKHPALSLLARGIIASIAKAPSSAEPGLTPSTGIVCVFTVEVTLDGAVSYAAACRQAVPAAQLPTLLAPGAAVAVRVNPRDQADIELALDIEPPSWSHREGAEPPDLGTEREACRAVIVESVPLGAQSTRTGEDLYALTLAVLSGSRPAYRIDVGSPVPKTAHHLLFPGSALPAKRIPGGSDRDLAIDWEAALTQNGVRNE